MLLIDYLDSVSFCSRRQSEQALLLLYYDYKECGKTKFKSKDINRLFSDAGKYSQINTSRIIRALLTDEKIRKTSKLHYYEYVPVCLQGLEKQYSKFWLEVDYIESDSEVINEFRYQSNRNTINKLVKQINCCYRNHCFDGCAVLMRRLFEILLILTYEKAGLEDTIKQNGSYMNLDRLVKDAINNKTLNLSRNKQCYDQFRNIGNFSAHGLYYSSTIKEIDDIKLSYKNMMDELFEKSGLFCG